jgi:acyl transferase domain-containing protein
VGVFVGIGSHGVGLGHASSLPKAAEAFIASGASTAIVSNRLSFCLKVKGPSLSLDTACSSALVALDVGFNYLRLQACSAALCGAVQVSDAQATVVMQLAHELSSNGRCATFDATADGFARGEGSGAVWFTISPTEAEMQLQIASLTGIAVQH